MDEFRMDSFNSDQRNTIDRRVFLGKLSLMSGSLAAFLVLPPVLKTHMVWANMISADDPRLETKTLTYTGATGDVNAYFAKPKGDDKLPGVVVIHENRGLNAHIKDVTRRIAVEGFQALAPDALSPAGGTPDEQDRAVKMIGELDPEKTTEDFTAAVKYLAQHPFSTGKVGVVGFCWGGAMANQMAVRVPELAAAVPYYGRQPAVEDVPKINAPLLLHYAGLDERINKGIPEYEEALKSAGKDYTIYMYDGAAHAFNNDTNPERYNPEAAKLAWQRTIAFLKEKLKTP
jgi:carboxymethylenebutenolidase